MKGIYAWGVQEKRQQFKLGSTHSRGVPDELPVIAALQPGTLLVRRPAAPFWASSEAAQGGPTVGQEDGISQTAKSMIFLWSR